MNKDTLKTIIERKITEAFSIQTKSPTVDRRKLSGIVGVGSRKELRRAAEGERRKHAERVLLPKRNAAQEPNPTTGIPQDIANPKKSDPYEYTGTTGGRFGTGEYFPGQFAAKGGSVLAKPKPDSPFMSGLKRAIGTKDDFRLGHRQGYVGTLANKRAKNAALDKGGEGEWQAVKRRQADRRVQGGQSSWKDLYSMSRNPEEFNRDYKKRQGSNAPGFDDDGPGGTTVGNAKSYHDATKDDRTKMDLGVRGQAKRLAGDLGAVGTFRVSAAEKEKAYADKREAEKEAMTPDERQAYDAEREANLYKEKEARKQAGISRGADDDAHAQRVRDYPYTTKRGISSTGKPISTGGVPWWKVGRGADKPLPDVINPAPEFEKPPKDPKKKKGEGPDTGKGSKSGASQKTPKGGRTGVRGAAGGDTRDVQAREIGASTELIGPRIAEMMQKRLKRNV